MINIPSLDLHFCKLLTMTIEITFSVCVAVESVCPTFYQPHGRI